MQLVLYLQVLVLHHHLLFMQIIQFPIQQISAVHNRYSSFLYLWFSYLFQIFKEQFQVAAYVYILLESGFFYLQLRCHLKVVKIGYLEFLGYVLFWVFQDFWLLKVYPLNTYAMILLIIRNINMKCIAYLTIELCYTSFYFS